MRLRLLTLLSATLAVVTTAGCVATRPSEGVRLATAIAAERDGRFARSPRRHSGNVTVHSETPGTVPADFAVEAAGIRRRFRSLFGRPPHDPTPLTILVFDTPRRLQVSLGVSNGVHGLALTREADPTIVLAAGEGAGALRRHLRHEIAHVVSDLTASTDLPPGRTAWVEEGIAYLLEWTDGDEPPRPSAALLHILNDRAPNPALIPQLMSTQYRPRGDAATMRRLAAGAATLVHYYWDRAARRGAPGVEVTVEVGALLRECARRTPRELHRDASAWTSHWRRLHRLARAREAAQVSARFLEAYVAGARAEGSTDASALVRPMADSAKAYAKAAHRASAPGAALSHATSTAARRALTQLRAYRTAVEAQDPDANDDELHRMLIVAQQQLGVAVAAGDDAAARRVPAAFPAPR